MWHRVKRRAFPCYLQVGKHLPTKRTVSGRVWFATLERCAINHTGKILSTEFLSLLTIQHFLFYSKHFLINLCVCACVCACAHAIATCETPVGKLLSTFPHNSTRLSLDFSSLGTNIAQAMDFCNSYLNAFPFQYQTE